MSPTQIIALAAASVELAGKVMALVEAVKVTLSANDLATLEAELEAVHDRNLQLGADLDAALAEAAKG